MLERGHQPTAEVDAGTGPVGDPLIVLGMHRSGTSALTGALSLLGVELGEPLMEPTQGENTRGYFEHLEIYRFHQRLLESIAVSWDDLRSPRIDPGDPLFARLRTELAEILRNHFAGAATWAVKDPRACRFVPLWHEALTELGCIPRYVIIVRHPDEVAASLGRRDRFSRDKSDLLWADHYLAAETATRGSKRVFAGYAELLTDPPTALSRIARELEIEWPAGEGAAIREELSEFLSKRLRHHVSPDEALMPRGRLGSIAPRLWQLLEAATADSPDPAICDALHAELREIQADFDPLLVEHFSQIVLRGELGRRVHELERARDQITEWLRVQSGELDNQRASLRSIEEQLEERTRWLRIQDEILHRQIARIDELEGVEPDLEGRGDEP